MLRTVTYKNRNYDLTPQHKRFISEGWKVVSEEETKEFSPMKALVLLIVFFPLVLFARSKRIKVTYQYNEQKQDTL